MVFIEKFAKKKKYLIWLLVIVAFGFVLKMTLLAPPKVRTASPAKRDLVAEVYGNGTVEAKVVVGISSKVTGRIVELHVDQGDRVKRGQLLARLENDDLLHQERQSKAALDRSGANLAAERANLRKAQANQALAEQNARRFGALAEKNLVAKLEAEQYDTAEKVAREEVARSEAAIEALQMEQHFGRSGVGVARSRVADTLIYAPQDGVIISRNLEKGAIVSPGSPIFTLADPATVWVRANVDEAQLKGVEPGKPAKITLRSGRGEQLAGHVARIGRESDRVTEELEVDVAFHQPLKQFRLGEQSEVYIVTETRKDAAAIPSSAIVTRNKKTGVWVFAEGRLSFREVGIGITDRQNFTEIVSGLGNSERVVLAPQAQMLKFKDGMKVRI